MIEKLPTESQQRLMAMIGLAASESDEIGACPSEEELAAFIDDEPQGHTRRAMLGHLNHCPNCYYHWLEVTALLESAEPEPEKEHHPKQVATVWQRLQAWSEPWKLALPAAAVAAMVMLVVLWPVALDISQRIDVQYASGVQFSEALTKAAQGLPLPWEAAAFGFTQSESSLPSRAFGAGVWSGRATLIGEDKGTLPETFSAPDKGMWSETQWTDYYQFGRWAVLLWAQTSSDQTGSEQTSVDWSEHRSIAVALQAGITERAQAEQASWKALRELNHIEQLLTATSGKEPGDTTRLNRRLVLVIQRLAPPAP